MQRSLREVVQSFSFIEDAIKVLQAAAYLGYVALMKQDTGPTTAFEVPPWVNLRPLGSGAVPGIVEVSAV